MITPQLYVPQQVIYYPTSVWTVAAEWTGPMASVLGVAGKGVIKNVQYLDGDTGQWMNDLPDVSVGNQIGLKWCARTDLPGYQGYRIYSRISCLFQAPDGTWYIPANFPAWVDYLRAWYDNWDWASMVVNQSGQWKGKIVFQIEEPIRWVKV